MVYTLLSENLVFEMKVQKFGSFTIPKYIRDIYFNRWHINWDDWFPLIILDENGEELFRIDKKLSRQGSISSPDNYSKYVESYKRMRFTITHYLEKHKGAFEIKLQKL